MHKSLVILLSLAILLVGCGHYPKDPNGTLNKVQHKILMVGIAASDSATNTSLMGPQVNIDFVNAFAASLNARVQWVKGTESDLVKLVAANHLHMALGSFTSSTPFIKEIGISKPYHTVKIKVGAPFGMALPEKIEGKNVLVLDRRTAALIKEQQAIPVMIDSTTTINGLIAASEVGLEKRKLQAQDKVLHKEQYVIAIPKGENAFLFELESFIDNYAKAGKNN